MCLIIFSFDPDSDLPLVVAANRDEFFARPTLEADYWQPRSGGATVLSGRDEVAGGTWIGLSDQRRFAAVTNIRDPSQETARPRSRGELTVDFLAGSQNAADYAQQLTSSFQDFAGYNLLLWDGAQMWYLNNLKGVCTRLSAGLYGLSNGALDSHWPKIDLGKEMLEAVLAEPQAASTDALLAMMDQRQQAADDVLPETGVGLELERILSPAFISNPQRSYGTRCSSALVCEKYQDRLSVRFSEQNYDQQGRAGNRHFFQFMLSASTDPDVHT
jgi:uncharacterized protein with NRDE domain